MSKCYEVLDAETAEDLADMVQRAIDSGKIPCAGVCVYPVQRGAGDQKFTDYWFAQAVCTPEALMPAARWLHQEINKCRRIKKTRA
jgi:hypothetical protein